MKHSTIIFPLSLGINIVLGIITALTAGLKLTVMLQWNLIWLLPFAIVLLGVLFGYIINLLLSKSNETTAYVIGQALAAVCNVFLIYSLVR
jgi:uncharacterized membrane protein